MHLLLLIFLLKSCRANRSIAAKMRLGYVLLAAQAALFAPAAADTMTMVTACYIQDSCAIRRAWWQTKRGIYPVDHRDGCRYRNEDIKIPGAIGMCIDHTRGRGHIWFYGQPKRCFVRSKERERAALAECGSPDCYLERWFEQRCTW